MLMNRNKWLLAALSLTPMTGPKSIGATDPVLLADALNALSEVSTEAPRDLELKVLEHLVGSDVVVVDRRIEQLPGDRTRWTSEQTDLWSQTWARIKSLRKRCDQ